MFVAARHDGEQFAEAVIDRIRTVPDVDAGCDYARRAENTLPAFGVDGVTDRDAPDVGARDDFDGDPDDDLDGDTDTGDTGGVGEWGC